MKRILLDGMAIRPGGRGVARALRKVFPLLVARTDGAEYVVVTSAYGREALSHLPNVLTAPLMPMSLWEQVGLPTYARRVKATAVYSLAECGPLWGPPVVLHIPEDPHVRWTFTPVNGPKEYLRRTYQRAAMRRSVLRCRSLITCSHSVANQLADRFGDALPPTEVVPLGVDYTTFHPGETKPKEDLVFHLGSEARDQSVLVVKAYAHALQLGASLPDLAIAGNLGRYAQAVIHEAKRLHLEHRVQLLGRISDEQLRRCYADAALCVQPALYEGFGLQPLEALACGAALIVSTTPAVDEVVEDAAVVVQPHSADALGTEMADLWTNNARRCQLRHKGQQRARRYPWEATADHLHALLQTFATGDHLPNDATDLPTSTRNV
ncbi:MAG: glycosyltransferase [Actinobacteria bacterium]|nr:glycosyltransferase [Actinomycetota bacterium]